MPSLGKCVQRGRRVSTAPVPVAPQDPCFSLLPHAMSSSQRAFAVALLSCLSVSALSSSTQGQAQAILTPGDDLDVFGTQYTINGTYGFLWDTSSGGYVSLQNASPSSFYYGRISTEEPGPFGDETTGQVYTIPYPTPDGRVLHSVLYDLYLDDTRLLSPGDPMTGYPGVTWGSYQTKGVTDAGEPLLYGSYIKSDGTFWTGLFVGVSGPPIYSNETPLGPNNEVGYPLLLSAFSPNGVHIAYAADVLGLDGRRDMHVLLDGVIYNLGGSPVIEDVPVPPSIGGIGGESWRNFRFFDLTDEGDFLIAGDTDGSTTTDAFLIRDESIYLREGMIIDGDTMVGDFHDARWAPEGRAVWIWNSNFDTGIDQALGVDDRIYIRSNDPVDWDKDGFADEEYTLRGLDDNAVVTVDDKIVFHSNVIGPFSLFYTVAFELPLSFLIPRTWVVSAATGGGIDFDLDAGPSAAGQFYFLAGSMSGTNPGFVLGGKTIPLNPDAYLVQTVAQANSLNFVATLGILDAEGQASAQILVPADLSLVGLRGHHAAVRFDLGPLTLHEVSPAMAVEITP